MPARQCRQPAQACITGYGAADLDEPAAARQAACLGLGVALLAFADVPEQLERGELVGLLPPWWCEMGMVSVYYANRPLLPAKTRVFIDYLIEALEQHDYPRRFTHQPTNPV